MLRFDRAMTFKRFGALDADQAARVDAVVAKAKASADQAAALVPGFVTQGWDTLIGAGSSVDALRSNAAAAQNLYVTEQAKADALKNDPDAGEADVEAMEGVAGGALQNTASAAAAQQLSLEAAYQQVVVKSAQDVGNMVTNPFGIPIWLWGVGAVGLLLLWKMPRRK